MSIIKYSAKPVLRWHHETNEWEVAEAFRVEWVSDNPKYRSIAFDVPEGFRTDLASMPAFMRAFNATNGHHLQAAIVHDYIYRTAAMKVTKAEGDEMFFDGMLYRDTALYRARYMWVAVKGFGGSSYVPRS